MLVQYQSPSFLVVHVNNPGVTGKRFYSYLSCEIGSQHWVNIFTIILSSSWQTNLWIFSRSFLFCIILTRILLSNLINLSVVRLTMLTCFLDSIDLVKCLIISSSNVIVSWNVSRKWEVVGTCFYLSIILYLWSGFKDHLQISLL